MKKQFIFLLFIFINCYQVIAFSAYVSDSVGIESANGEKQIIHEVEAGETLYALSRKYNVDVNAIKNANGESVNNLSIGQKILIPLPKNLKTKGSIVHVVKSSETLFSISRQYGVKVDDLRKWNNLAENSISVGQQLTIKEVGSTSITTEVKQNQDVVTSNRKTHVVEQSQTLYSISRLHSVSTDQLIGWNNLGSNALNIGQVLIVSSEGSGATEQTASNSSMLPSNQTVAQDEKINNSMDAAKSSEKTITETAVVLSPIIEVNEADNIEKPAEKIVQKGLAEVIEDTEDTKKYLALHRDAPIGTIMQVRNEMNNQSVFVRVVNSIPATGDNSKVILMISKKAYDRLGAVDRRFPVEISYIP